MTKPDSVIALRRFQENALFFTTHKTKDNRCILKYSACEVAENAITQ